MDFRQSPSGVLIPGFIVRPQVSPNPDSAAANTRIIQDAIDGARVEYLRGNGGAVVVELPSMRIPLGPSTLAETYWNFGVQVPATSGCLVMRDGVKLLGQGIGNTILAPNSPTLDAVYIVDGNNQSFENLEIDGSWAGSGAGHALFQVTSENDNATTVNNLVISDVYCHDVGSYGLGLENGVFTNVVVTRFRALNTGADGIDIKNRPLPANVSRGIFLDDIYIDSPGRRLDGQTGIDVRGIVQAVNIVCVGIGRTGVEMNGFRFRTYGANEGWGDKSSLSNFYIKAASPAFNVTGGLSLGSANVAVSNGVVEDCINGVWVTGNGTAQADNTSINGVKCINAATRGFYVETASDRVTFVQCTAITCGIGFRNEGQQTTLALCAAVGCTTNRSTSGGALQSEMLISGSLEQDILVMQYLTAGRVGLEARGASADIDIAIDPKGAGRIRYGTYTAGTTPTYSGTIPWKDSSGVQRLLMVAT